MKLITPLSEFENLLSRSMVTLSCEYCGKSFKREKHEVQKVLKGHPAVFLKHCSRKCAFASRKLNKTVDVTCSNCGKTFNRQNSKVLKRNFCSQTCSGIYNNAHKTHGYRRSKMEIWLESSLSMKYAGLEIHYNRKDTINGELDIYIPSLKLAFELNGIFHYEPIYGSEKLTQIQNNDGRKFQACLERGIELCIIDISSQKRFTTKTSIKYFEIICKIIDSKLGRPTGYNPVTHPSQG